MSQFKGIMKNGWHPEKSGTGIRDSVSGLMGRNKDRDDSSSNHAARPLTDLKDPASFAPPPKRTGSGILPASKPVSTQRKVITAPSKYADPRAGPVGLPPRNTGTGLESGETSTTREAQNDTGGHHSRPYQANNTGLSTNNPPQPPGRSPPSYDEATSGAAVPKALPPSLPPRLPPRGAAGGSEKDDRLNEGAVNNLRPGTGKWGAQVSQLQGRFAKMGTPSTASSVQEQPPSQGTTWAQKQAALKTASAFQKDPSSISLSDAKAAASTANNFRQRHGEQVAGGVRAANNFNQKYGIADKLGSYSGSQTTQPAQNKSSPPPLPRPSQPYTGTTNDASEAAVPGLAGKKKLPPPPPPKKKPDFAAAAPSPPSVSQEDGDVPPPIPMSTRPQF